MTEHVFGHHADDVDPWDALLADVKALEAPDGVYTALVTFWRGEARKAEAAPQPPTAAPGVERCAYRFGPEFDGRVCGRERSHDIHDDLTMLMGAHAFTPAADT